MLEHMADYKIQLVRLSEEHIIAFKEEMQEAFEHGFKSHCHENEDANDDSNQWQVLPDKDFYQSLEAEGAEAYEAIIRRSSESHQTYLNGRVVTEVDKVNLTKRMVSSSLRKENNGNNKSNKDCRAGRSLLCAYTGNGTEASDYTIC